mmetsp:Transcript_77429/g.206740  ORF Transcript_77429/g.206740 Transcript_77429/m.206740 type:complete len:271 (+) Transcript_77429:1394-2206(+)
MCIDGDIVHRHQLLQVVLECLQQVIQDLLDLTRRSATGTPRQESQHLGPVASAQGLHVLDDLLELALRREEVGLGLHEGALRLMGDQRGRLGGLHGPKHSHHLFQLGDRRFHVAFVCLELLLVCRTQGHVSVSGVLCRTLLTGHLRLLDAILPVQCAELVHLSLRLRDVDLGLLNGSLLLLAGRVAIALELGIDLALGVALLLRFLLHLAKLFNDLLHRAASSCRAPGRHGRQQGKASHAVVVLHASPGLKRSPDSGIQRPAEPPYHTPT